MKIKTPQKKCKRENVTYGNWWRKASADTPVTFVPIGGRAEGAGGRGLEVFGGAGDEGAPSGKELLNTPGGPQQARGQPT